MGHYKSNLRDIEFTLFEVLGREALLGRGPYEDIDRSTASSILAEVDRMSRDELAESYPEDDHQPPRYDPAQRTVTLPDGFKKSFQALMDSQVWRFGIPEQLGGTPLPPSLSWAIAELILGANAPAWMYASGPTFAATVWRNGTPEQRRLARLMIDRRWAATMVITEPDAGSDVGAGRTRAIPQPDGTWHLEGVKRFITGGEHDLTENIVHLVLARPTGVEGVGGPGTKGLSLFLVPKYLVDVETGRLGRRNGVYATNLEHKMGLTASATCELTFGDGEPAVGYLLGDVHDGIAQMFQVIAHARMLVGTKAIATLSTGYLNALDFAKQRIQGPDLKRMGDPSAPRVPIIAHPEIRRSLLTQKAYAEGLRALVLYTATFDDQVQTGQDDAGRTAARVHALLLPIVKGYGSERAWALLGSEALQTFGGSGYLRDYPLEQYVRDAKIDTLYEGTTAMQAQDLYFRKIVKDEGRALEWLYRQIAESLDQRIGGEALRAERSLLATGLADVQAIVATMTGDARAENVYRIGQNTTQLLLALGDLIVGWLLLRQAAVASDVLAGDPPDAAFYQGKVAAARFFARTVLPRLAAERAAVETTDDSLMELDVAAF